MKKIFKIILTFIKVRYFSKWTSRDKLLEYQKKLFAVYTFIRYNRHCRVPLKILLKFLTACWLIASLSFYCLYYRKKKKE